MATKITGVLTGNKNDACNTCSCGNLILPTGLPGPAGATGPAGAPGPTGPPGSAVLIKRAQYFDVATGGGGTPGTWETLYEFLFFPGPGEVYDEHGGGFRFEFTLLSCENDAIPSPDTNVAYRLYNATTTTEIYKTGDHSALPGSLVNYPIQKHRMVMAWNADPDVRWGGRVEVIAGHVGVTCPVQAELFSGNLADMPWSQLNIGAFGLLNPVANAFDFSVVQHFQIQYNTQLGTGASIILSEFLAEFIPAPT